MKTLKLIGLQLIISVLVSCEKNLQIKRIPMYF